MNANEKVFVMLKPDCQIRGLTGKIISMFENVGLKIVDMKLIMATREQAEKHYPNSDEWLISVGNKSLTFYKENNLNPADFFTDISPKGVGIEIKKHLVNYLTMGPMIAISFSGYEAIKVARKVAGATVPVNAEMGSIRGTYSNDNPVSSAMEKRCIYNLVHVSDSPEAVADEMKIWM
ncbi:MAG: hypothetical protein LBU68_01215 [Rickettsiales bacterium]|jgi:nucleoside-diphosphate kinase|nr:hypothetical protein [Rickettsiales bacterium]